MFINLFLRNNFVILAGCPPFDSKVFCQFGYKTRKGCPTSTCSKSHTNSIGFFAIIQLLIDSFGYIT